ncbi:MAG: histidine phosphatase family protein [Candidatus Pelethousia sp.]|nr:histidine phosphatase family protein [Candidatus Pelethousia sp.]
MKTVYFIRHGSTAGNQEKRYIGRTDEPLCQQGEAQAAALAGAGFPAFDCIFSSPYLRCRQTAAILFPGRALILAPGLKECDFGLFEGKTADELSSSPEYVAWLDTGCITPLPGGESVMGFKARCCEAFLQAVAAISENGSAAFVIHGGCIMAILEQYALPKRTFYEYHIKNGGWVRCALAKETLTIEGGALC